MLIKFHADDELAERIKAMYGQRVASKAFLMAAAEAPDLYCKADELSDLVEAQKYEIQRLKRVIEQARSAAAQLLERTGQSDLLGG